MPKAQAQKSQAVIPVAPSKGATAAVWMDLDELRPWPGNPRSNARAVDAVARSLEAHGWGRPIIARAANREIIAGHTTLLAAKKLQRKAPETWSLVPVRLVDLDEATAHSLAIADNKTAELSEWDDDLLARILADLPSPETSGFSTTEIERLIRAAAGPANAADDPGAQIERADELRDKWRTLPGQLWELPSVSSPGKSHRLLCGDATNRDHVQRLMGGERAAWCWTDPPFGVAYEGKTKDALTIQNDSAAGLPDLLRNAFDAVDGVLADGAPIYVAHPAGPLSLEFGRAFVEAGWHLHESLVWAKDSMVLGHSDYHYMHEPILYGWKGKNRPWYGGRDKTSILSVPRPTRSELHPTMKPPALIAMCLQNSSRRGDLGLDPFCGSGTTIVAAEQTARVCYGVEIDPKYVAVVLERLAGMGLQPRLAP